MVTVNFRLTEAGEVNVELNEPQPLARVLDQAASHAGIELGGVIAVRSGQVITLDTPINDDDIIDVFPAISGG